MKTTKELKIEKFKVLKINNLSIIRGGGDNNGDPKKSKNGQCVGNQTHNN